MDDGDEAGDRPVVQCRAMATRVESAAENRCPACDGPLGQRFTASASEVGLAPVEVARCEICGSGVTMGGFPADADLYEKGAYAPEPARGASLAAPILKLFDRQRLRLVQRKFRPPATLVDAGAGRGRFVSHARALGYLASGVEPSERGCMAARHMYGLELVQSSIEEAQILPESVDVVTLWHVLEHVPDPGATLDALAGWLRPGGGLLVGVPNLGGLQAAVGGDRWFHLDLPRHRTHFTVEGLHTLLSRHGYVVIATHQQMAEHNWFGMWQSAVSRATRRPSYMFHLLKRNAPVWTPDFLLTALALPLLPFAVLAEVTAAACGSGGSMAVMAVKSGAGKVT